MLSLVHVRLPATLDPYDSLLDHLRRRRRRGRLLVRLVLGLVLWCHGEFSRC
jgi:hypothetical protein